MEKGICKLCQEYKHLCKKSHIIPSFLYRPLKGKNNTLLFIDNTGTTTRSSNGEYESNILCVMCETKIIGKLDNYGSKFLHNDFDLMSNKKIEMIDGNECVVLENDKNYDYVLFKLFLMSMLWRASISTRPFFQSLKLNSETEENIREMLLRSNPGEPHEYPCLVKLPPITKKIDGTKEFNTFFMPTTSPSSWESGNIHVAEMIILGSHYYFITSMPPNWCVVPSIQKNKLIMGFMTTDEQLEIHKKIIHFIKKI